MSSLTWGERWAVERDVDDDPNAMTFLKVAVAPERQMRADPDVYTLSAAQWERLYHLRVVAMRVKQLRAHAYECRARSSGWRSQCI